MRNPTVSCINISFSEHSLSAYCVPGTYVAGPDPAVKTCIYCSGSMQRARRRGWLVLQGWGAGSQKGKMVSGLSLETYFCEHEL